MRVGGEHHGLAALPTRKKPATIVQEAGWNAQPVWTVRKISPAPGFDPRTVQLAASRYTE